MNGETIKLMDENEELKENYLVSSLVRGLKILSTFTPSQPALKVSEIAEKTGIDQATVFRFVYTLEKLGYLVRDKETKRYRQGVKMLTISLPARSGIAVRDKALPIMTELSKRINETVKATVLDDVDIVTIAVLEVMDKLVYPTPIGHRAPAYCTAMGKVLLAFQPVENWDKLISRIDFLPRTEQTIVDPAAFRAELANVRRQGYAIQDGELVVGYSSIAAPIFGHDHTVAAAMNISGLSIEVLNKDKIGFFTAELIKSAFAVSAQLGYVQGLP